MNRLVLEFKCPFSSQRGCQVVEGGAEQVGGS